MDLGFVNPGLIFDWVFMLMMTASGITKILGFEKKPVAKLGLNYNWIIGVGILQLIAIYFIFTQNYLPAVFLIGGPYLIVAALSIRIKEYVHVLVLVALTAMITARWISFNYPF